MEILVSSNRNKVFERREFGEKIDLMEKNLIKKKKKKYLITVACLTPSFISSKSDILQLIQGLNFLLDFPGLRSD